MLSTADAAVFSAVGRRAYLASATAPEVPAHNVLVVLVLLGQVVEEHALGHRLKHGARHTVNPFYFITSLH